MAFGLFKKSQVADLVLHNGRFITCDPDSDSAESLACKDGEIIAIGSFEAIEPLIGKDTEVVDLYRKYALPGLINTIDSPVAEVFDGEFANLCGVTSLQDMADRIRSWYDYHPDEEIIFGYGYSEALLPENPADDATNENGNNEDADEAGNDGDNTESKEKPEIISLLDDICPDKPLVVLCESTVSCLLNSEAAKIVQETAEEEMVQFITVPYILNLLLPFDFNKVEEKIQEQLKKSTALGITSVLNTGTPDYFETLYQDSLLSMYNENRLPIRFFGSYMMNRPLLPKGLVHRLMARKTICNEIDGVINAEMLYIDLNEAACPMDFSQDALNEILENVSDKGFSIYVNAHEASDLQKAMTSLDHIRSKGYKNIFVIKSDCTIDDTDFIYADSGYYLGGDEDVFNMSIEDFIETVTIEGALILGCEDSIGSLEKGKRADIAVFDKDPMTMSPKEFWQYPACMTIFNGNIIE